MTGRVSPGGDAAYAPTDAAEARLVEGLLREAVEARASDVHFELDEAGLRIRWRADGALRERGQLPPAPGQGVLTHLKARAGLPVEARDAPQDGRLSLPIGGSTVEFRLAALPTLGGESVVLRVLDARVARRDLDALGMPGALRQQLDAVLERPQGLLLVVGPTGVGKTTTLYALLEAFNDGRRKLVTVEDPVEYACPDAVQTQLDPQRGLEGVDLLRALLRHDPDVLLVGEVRDAATLRVMLQAALTGHWVLASLHAADVAGAGPRLAELGAEPGVLREVLVGVLSQRLLPTRGGAGRCACFEAWWAGQGAAWEAGALHLVPKRPMRAHALALVRANTVHPEALSMAGLAE